MTDPITGIKPGGMQNSPELTKGQNKVGNISDNSAIKIKKLLGAKSKKEVSDPESRSLDNASKNFEKIFVSLMLKSMWKSIPKDEESETPGSNIYMEMVQSALVTEMVKGEGLGIAKMLSAEFKNNGVGGKEK